MMFLIILTIICVLILIVNDFVSIKAYIYHTKSSVLKNNIKKAA